MTCLEFKRLPHEIAEMYSFNNIYSIFLETLMMFLFATSIYLISALAALKVREKRK